LRRDFRVERRRLIEGCLEQLIGNPEKGGRHFTVWAPRQTGKTWKDFYRAFSRKHGLWDRPLILFIDEADTAPPLLLDLMVNQLREMYLKREDNRLHGLAIVGVRAVPERAEDQAVRYARKLDSPAIALAVFVPSEDEEILRELSAREVRDDVELEVVAIGWA